MVYLKYLLSFQNIKDKLFQSKLEKSEYIQITIHIYSDSSKKVLTVDIFKPKCTFVLGIHSVQF